VDIHGGAEGSFGAKSHAGVHGGGEFHATLLHPAEPGDTVLSVDSHAGLHTGAQIAVGHGGNNEEVCIVAGFGSIKLEEGLKFKHVSGEDIIALTNPALVVAKPGFVNGHIDAGDQSVWSNFRASFSASSPIMDVSELVKQNHSALIQEMRDFAITPQQNWEEQPKVRGNRTFMHKQNGSDGLLGIMGRGRVMASREEIVRVIYNMTKAAVSIEPFVDLKVLEIIRPNQKTGCPETIACRMELDAPKIQCDFCVAISASKVDGPSVPKAEEEWVLGITSIEHESGTPHGSLTRAKMLLGGWHIKPLRGKSSAASCGVTAVRLIKLKDGPTKAMSDSMKEMGADMILNLQEAVAAAHPEKKKQGREQPAQRRPHM